MVRIRFTAPQLALIKQRYPSCNFDGLAEITFVFAPNGKVVNCFGAITDGGSIERYVSTGLYTLAKTAMRRWELRKQGSKYGTVVPLQRVP